VYLTTPRRVTELRSGIQVDDPEGASLVYQYQNQPLANAMKSMHMHYGTAMLRYRTAAVWPEIITQGATGEHCRICCKRVSVKA